MLKRRFGRSGHMSTVAIFGGAAFSEISQEDADRVMEQVIEAGINHIDIAPSYGQAEERVGPWMKQERSRFFLGCKTMERTKEGAWNELRQSLKRLQTDSFDLYQCHAITTMQELDAVTMPGGALEAFEEARREGLVKHLGITGHGVNAPEIYLEALQRFDFDSVLFPINFVQMGNPDYRRHAKELISVCRAKDVGTMVIKAVTKAPWGDRERTATTWYEPFDQMDEIQRAVNFALSYEITGLCTPGDVRILPMFLQACENFVELNHEQIEELIELGRQYEPLFPPEEG
ncbi:MAG TPA: aldo/keto reductase [Anaerolineales bacterium]|nr:aldo/keto reductase [Anaerolineales bacterium]